MAKAINNSIGYEFSGLKSVGKQLVNKSKLQHPWLCETSPYLDFRLIRFGTPEQNRVLVKLVINVRERDPETISPSTHFTRSHVAKD